MACPRVSNPSLSSSQLASPPLRAPIRSRKTALGGSQARLLTVLLGMGLGACGTEQRPPVESNAQQPESDIVRDAGTRKGSREGSEGVDASAGRLDAGSGGSEDGPSDAGEVDAAPEGPVVKDAGKGPDGGTDAGAPLAPFELELSSPTTSTDGSVVFSELVEAVCEITDRAARGATPHDATTVQLTLTNSLGEELERVPGKTAGPAGTYEADFIVNELPSGAYTVGCEALDSGSKPQRIATNATVLVDHGPIVEILSPLEDSFESSATPVAFEYRILPDELFGDDDGSEITSAELVVRGVPFELLPAAGEENVYRVSVDFANPMDFPMTPDGVTQATVRATNDRGEQSVSRAFAYSFSLDGKPPQVTINSPVDNAVVGGTTFLKMTVTDEQSGVNWNSLVVTLGNETYRYSAEDDDWSLAGSQVTLEFETGEIGGSVRDLAANVHVTDTVGNESLSAEATIYYRDEQPPLLALDPPNFREINQTGLCSISFDPVGDRALNHGQSVKNFTFFRTLAWDQTNSAEGQPHYYYATVDQGSVELWFREAGRSPLVLDRTGDGTCDDVEEEGSSFQALEPVAPGGFAYYAPPSEELSATPPLTNCEYWEPPPNNLDLIPARPKKLCAQEHSDMELVIAHGWINSGKEPVVYAYEGGATGLQCTGRDLELRAQQLADYDGWVCVASRALDEAGNRGVSDPIAVCYDNDAVPGVPDCWGSGPAGAPDCTDGCSPIKFRPEGLLNRKRP